MPRSTRPAAWGQRGERMAAVRRGSGRSLRRCVLIFDQFERWLAGRSPGSMSDLVAALRQCDGDRLVALLLVRDEYWTATAEFTRALDLPLAEADNAMALQPFPRNHARQVLAQFGRAYGSYPPGGDEAAGDKFLDRVLDELAEEGRVLPAQLALVAELLRDEVWTPALLSLRGGVRGLLRQHLDQTFGATAPKPQRRHRAAVQAVLDAMLPAADAAVGQVGPARTRDELVSAAGYAESPEAFNELLALLEDKLRIVRAVESATGPPNYMISHDVLVQPFAVADAERSYIARPGTNKLDRLAAAYAVHPEPRHLPTWWEWPGKRGFQPRSQIGQA